MLEVQLPKLICFSKYVGFQGAVFPHFHCDSQKNKSFNLPFEKRFD